VKHIVHLTTVHRAFDTRIFHKECRSLAGVGYRVSPIGHYEQPARWIKTKCPLPRVDQDEMPPASPLEP